MYFKTNYTNYTHFMLHVIQEWFAGMPLLFYISVDKASMDSSEQNINNN